MAAEPDVAEKVFDRCLSYGVEKDPEQPDYEITFNYEFLDDVYANWMDSKRDTTSESGSSSGVGVYDEDDKLLAGARPYTSDSNLLKKNHPLMIMVGLAVDDIKAVQDQAALKRMAMQVGLALDVERILPDFIRRKSYVRRKMFRPNEWLKNPIRRLFNFQSSMSSQAIQKALNPELDEIEKVQEGQDKLHADMKKMKRNMKDLREQISLIESMLRAIVTQSEHIHWQEEDFQEDEDEIEEQNLENLFSA